ncbi:MAG: exodeoxyribonuclease VII small subunit [Planctomycetes bacterium]|nr:exodeoxyribonuclease VII small subunit [Planctomycetota bacterium]
MAAKEKQAAAEETFDARLAKLEALVAELERGDLGLEASLERYQQGIELLRQCHGVLAAHKRQVQELAAGAEDALKPYAGDPDARA